MKLLLLITAVVVLLGQTSHVAAFQVQHHVPVVRKETALFGLLGRFRKQRDVDQQKIIEKGQKVPDIDVELLSRGEDGTIEAQTKSLLEIIGDSRTVLVGMPGAFTPTCTAVHAPGYIQNKDKLQKLGIEKIAVMTTNDKYVNTEWSEQTGLLKESDIDGSVVVLCDADGDAVKEMGLAEDMGFGVGVRSKRFAMVTDNGGVMETLLLDEGMDDCDATSAESLIKLLTPKDQVEESALDPKALAGVAGVAVALLLGTNVMMDGGSGSGSSSAPMRPAPTPKVKTIESKNAMRPGNNQEMSLLDMLKE